MGMGQAEGQGVRGQAGGTRSWGRPGVTGSGVRVMGQAGVMGCGPMGMRVWVMGQAGGSWSRQGGRGGGARQGVTRSGNMDTCRGPGS